MEDSVNETLEFVLFTTRRIKRKNVPKAILAMLMEMRLPEQFDGFEYLREAIFLKYNNPKMRFGSIYAEIARQCDDGANAGQVDKAIHAVIEAGWNARNEEVWGYFFENVETCPSNGKFIARMARVMELWDDCKKEVCYARK